MEVVEDSAAEPSSAELVPADPAVSREEAEESAAMESEATAQDAQPSSAEVVPAEEELEAPAASTEVSSAEAVPAVDAAVPPEAEKPAAAEPEGAAAAAEPATEAPPTADQAAKAEVDSSAAAELEDVAATAEPTKEVAPAADSAAAPEIAAEPAAIAASAESSGAQALPAATPAGASEAAETPAGESAAAGPQANAAAAESSSAEPAAQPDAWPEAAEECKDAEPAPAATASPADKSAQLHMLISQARGSQDLTGVNAILAAGGQSESADSGWAPTLGLQMSSAPVTQAFAPRVERYLQLRVQPGIGAGLSLRPTQWGMLVEGVEVEPGQPGLNVGDYLVEIGGRMLAGLPAEGVKEIFGKEFRHDARLGIMAPPPAQDSDPSNSWPEAVEVAPHAGVAGYPPAATAVPMANSAWSNAAGVGSSTVTATGEQAGGLLELVGQLTQQLSNETLRREHEEHELQERRKEEVRMREELEARRLRRADVRAAAEDAAKSAAEAKRQHADLVQTHVKTQKEVSEHEAELQELQQAALARSGRDWARDGPEKDALVQTKLQIAEAHDLLHQVRLQLRLNRDGLRRQLTELQSENNRLRAVRQAA